MSKITTLYINSKDRYSGVPENFNYYLNLGVNNNTSFIIKDVTIPFSNYVTVPDPENGDTFQSFELIEDNGVPSSVTGEIPIGNYTNNELQNLLKTELDSISPYNNKYTIDINENTYKTTITAGGPSHPFVINWTNSNVSSDKVYKRLGNILGWYDSDGLTVNAITPVGPVKTSPNAFNLTGGCSYFLKSSTLNLGSISFFNTEKNNVFLEVPKNQNPGSIIRYQTDLNIQQPYVITGTSYVDFKIVDEYDNQIDLNGLNWCLTLIIKNNSSI